MKQVSQNHRITHATCHWCIISSSLFIAHASLSFERPEQHPLWLPQMQPAAVRLPLLRPHCRQPRAGSLATCICTRASDSLHSLIRTRCCNEKLPTTTRQKPWPMGYTKQSLHNRKPARRPNLRRAFSCRDRAALPSAPRPGTAASAAASTPRLAISSWWLALAAVAARPAARASSSAAGYRIGKLSTLGCYQCIARTQHDLHTQHSSLLLQVKKG